MSKPVVIIADLDEDYILAIEKKLLIEIGNQIELEVITEAEYLSEFFLSPRTAEILLVSEELYTREICKHNIAHIFVLKEEVSEYDEANTVELITEDVNRYVSTNEIYNQIIRYSRKCILTDVNLQKETRVIAFYSAIGGTGKTSLSLGLAKSLSDKFNRVLYVNAESVQSFGYYLKIQGDQLSDDGYRSIRSAEDNVYSNLKSFLHTEGFYYLPPLISSLDSRNISNEIYKKIILEAKESKDYDYIIVDIEAGYSNRRIDLMMIADKVILTILPDAISVIKMNFIEQNISLNDKEKYVCVCNRCKQSDLSIEKNLSAINMSVQEMVFESDIELKTINDLSELVGMKALVQTI